MYLREIERCMLHAMIDYPTSLLFNKLFSLLESQLSVSSSNKGSSLLLSINMLINYLKREIYVKRFNEETMLIIAMICHRNKINERGIKEC